jgi:hypothetical protein
MANEKQLAILKQGVEAWNEWRLENPGARIDLREADLNGMDLWGAKLWWADLRESDLRGARYKETDFLGADLRETKTGEAKPIEAKFWNDLSTAEKMDYEVMSSAVKKRNLTAAADLATIVACLTVLFFGTQTIISVRTLPGLLMVLGLLLVCGGFAVLRWLESQVYGLHPNTPSATFILVVIGLILLACSALIYLFIPPY